MNKNLINDKTNPSFEYYIIESADPDQNYTDSQH